MKVGKNALCMLSLVFGLMLSFSAFAQDDHGEDTASATPINANGTIYDGELNDDNDIDFFSFNAADKYKYIIEITHIGDDCDTTVSFIDSSSALVVGNYSYFLNGDSTTYWFTPRTNRKFYIKVEPFNPGSIGAYTISITTKTLAGECKPCDSNYDCQSFNCGVPVSGDGPNLCIPEGKAEYTCGADDSESSSTQDSGCLIDTLVNRSMWRSR